jgi:hypothetical protein
MRDRKNSRPVYSTAAGHICPGCGWPKRDCKCSDLERAEGAAIFAGNVLPDGAGPIAQAYAGHQFGHFTALGDGRAIRSTDAAAQPSVHPT